MFGIISSTTEPFCRQCDRSRLTADGQWYRCLYARAGTDLRAPLRAGTGPEALADLIASTWRQRDDRGAEERLAADDRSTFIPVEALQSQPHLEMHTRGGWPSGAPRSSAAPAIRPAAARRGNPHASARMRVGRRRGEDARAGRPGAARSLRLDG